MKVSKLWFFLVLGLTIVAGLLMPTAVQAAPPLVSSVAPNQGTQGQTLDVIITGDNFTGASSVSFGPDITVLFTIDSPTQISASITIAEEATVGTCNVTVTVGTDAGTLVDGFTINQAPPTVNTVVPSLGAQGQTLAAIIRGTNFDGASSVDFGLGITVDNFTVDLMALGEVQVGTGTTSQPYPFYTYYCDARTQSILLASEIGQAGQIHKVRLYVSGRPGQNLNYFYIRMQHTTMNSFSSSTYVNSGWTTVLYATNVDRWSWTVPGWVEFTLTTPFAYDGVSNLLIDYTFDNSSYTSNGYCHSTSTASYRTISDHHDLYSGNMLNEYSGTRYMWYNNVVLVMDGSDVITANVTIDPGATPGSRDVSVTTPGGTYTVTDGFWVVAPPAITSIDPTQGLQGQSFNVTINGNDFTGTTAVGFGTGVNVNSFTVNSDTEITAAITVNSAASAGARDVSVTNVAGTDTLPGAFTVVQAPPTISSIYPTYGLQGQTYSVTIWGSYFTDASDVGFGPDITVNSFVINTTSRITANITIDPAAAAGPRDVTVTTPGGTATLSGSFVVVVTPVVNSLDPEYAGRGYTLDVTITGENFYYVSGVDFGTGVTVNSFTVDNATSMSVNITISGTTTVGTRYVSVSNPAGTGTKFACFTIYAPPVISSVEPTEAALGQTLDVIITGSYLTGASSVSFGPGVTVNSFAVDSASQITANITVDSDAAPGARNVSLTTLGGTACTTWGFRVFAPPTITAVLPARGIQGDTFDVFITGTCFEGLTSVGFGDGVTVNSFVLTLPTEIKVNVTVDYSAALGPRDVTVTTPGGNFTKDSAFNVVTLPDIASVEPAEAMPGQTLNVTINGSGFDGATAVSFGPGLVIKGFVVNSSIQIVAEITVGNTAVIGPRDVSVSTNVGVGTQPQGFAVIPLPDMTPDIEDMNPVAGLPGEDIQVVITGGNFTGATAISFGDGVTVRSFTVDSDTQISATISISRRAETGSRDVTVTTPEGTETLPGLFSIEVPPTSVPMYVWLLAGFGAAAVLLGLAGVLVWRKKLAH